MNTIRYDHFSRHDTEMFKGIGILLIVLHNFFHNLTPLIGENEFAFSPRIFPYFLQTLQTQPHEIVRLFFSYFGHYGVQIFVFFSSYGLTRKYAEFPLNFIHFMKARVYKIYFSFLLCMMIYIVLGLIKSFFFPDEKILYWHSLLWKLLLISNFIPHEALKPVGPWWFIPFIFQCYLLYPILLRLFQRFKAEAMLVISVCFLLAEWVLAPYLFHLDININHTPFGHMPVLCLGILLAGQKQIILRYDYLLLAFLLFILGNFNAFLWEISGLTFTLLVLFLMMPIKKLFQPRDFVAKCLIFYGGISFHLFMVNGFLRSPFHQFAETYNIWWMDNLSAFASLLFSTLFALVLRRLDYSLRFRFKKNIVVYKEQ